MTQFIDCIWCHHYNILLLCTMESSIYFYFVGGLKWIFPCCTDIDIPQDIGQPAILLDMVFLLAPCFVSPSSTESGRTNNNKRMGVSMGMEIETLDRGNAYVPWSSTLNIPYISNYFTKLRGYGLYLSLFNLKRCIHPYKTTANLKKCRWHLMLWLAWVINDVLTWKK